MKLPKAPRIRRSSVDQEEQLYAVEIVEEDSIRYKVYYVGYSHAFDEWKQKEEAVELDEDAVANVDQDDIELFRGASSPERFTLYRELATKI